MIRNLNEQKRTSGINETLYYRTLALANRLWWEKEVPDGITLSATATNGLQEAFSTVQSYMRDYLIAKHVIVIDDDPNGHVIGLRVLSTSTSVVGEEGNKRERTRIETLEVVSVNRTRGSKTVVLHDPRMQMGIDEETGILRFSVTGRINSDEPTPEFDESLSLSMNLHSSGERDSRVAAISEDPYKEVAKPILLLKTGSTGYDVRSPQQ